MSVLRMLERQLVARKAHEQAQQPEQQGKPWQGLVEALATELDRAMQQAAAPSADLAARLRRLELAAAHKTSDAGLEARLTRLEAAGKADTDLSSLEARLNRMEQGVEAHQTTTARHTGKLDRLEQGVGANNSSFLDLASRLYDLENSVTGQTAPPAQPETAPQNAAPENEPIIAFHRDAAGLIRHVDINGHLFRVTRGANNEILRLEPQK